MSGGPQAVSYLEDTGNLSVVCRPNKATRSELQASHARAALRGLGPQGHPRGGVCYPLQWSFNFRLSQIMVQTQENTDHMNTW